MVVHLIPACRRRCAQVLTLILVRLTLLAFVLKVELLSDVEIYKDGIA